MFGKDPEAEAVHFLKQIDKLEPCKLNYHKRAEQLDKIKCVYSSVRSAIVYELKAGLDEIDFAKLKIMGRSMKEVNDHLATVSTYFNQSFERYSVQIKKIMEENLEIEKEEG